jgi:hypothetical protein
MAIGSIGGLGRLAYGDRRLARKDKPIGSTSRFFALFANQAQNSALGEMKSTKALACLSPHAKRLKARPARCWQCLSLNKHSANRSTIHLDQRVRHSEVCQVTAMRTPMLPLVDIVRRNGLLTDETVDTSLASIANIFNFYSRDLVADSGHTLMIGETGYALNPPKSGICFC